MVEPITRSQNLPAAAALFSADVFDVKWQDKLNVAGKKKGIVGKCAPDWELEEEDNNQDDDGPHGAECVVKPRVDGQIDGDELHQLRHEDTSLAQRLALMEAQHAQRVIGLETKLQQAIITHNEIEQRLRAQLETVLHEQQEAVENARKVRTILSRVSTWARQVQRAANTQRAPFQFATPVSHDLELRMTPRTSAPYTLWTDGASLATNVAECQVSPSDMKFTLSQDHLPVHDFFEVQVDSNVEPQAHSLPPPAPGRSRVKSVPGKGFNYVACRPAEIATKPSGEIVPDGLHSVGTAPRSGTPVSKRNAGGLLAYCAQVVTTSLAGVRSSPSPHAKIMSAWRSDRLSPVREELQVDEEAGHCYTCLPNGSERVNVALPNLSIGLL